MKNNLIENNDKIQDYAVFKGEGGVGGQNDMLVLFDANFNAESFAFYRIKKFQLLFELSHETRDEKQHSCVKN